MKALAIIPARGGSKRIPHKNIKHFLGKPIIQYSIETALNSNLFDEVMVSTDDEMVAKVAEKAGAKIPFFRSIENADDFATLSDVVKEVITEYSVIGRDFENVCCILPTAVFITAERLSEAYNYFIQKGFDSVFPVLKFSYPIMRALQFKNEKIEMIWSENLNKRSQDLPQAYHDSGQFYWLNVNRFLLSGKIFSVNSSAIILKDFEAQDIDTLEDWEIAEMKYKLLENRIKK